MNQAIIAANQTEPEICEPSAWTVTQYFEQYGESLHQDHWIYLLAGISCKQGLFIIGITANGERKPLSQIRNGEDSFDLWEQLLLNLKDRNINTPALAIGAGELQFWNVLERIFPETNHQRCWFKENENAIAQKSSQKTYSLHTAPDKWSIHTRNMKIDFKTNRKPEDQPHLSAIC